MREIIREHRPRIIIIIEPRISGDAPDRMCEKLGKRRWIRAEATGFSRGIWVLWEKEEISVTLKVVHKSFIHMEVESASRKRWTLTAVYASSQLSARQFIWGKLNELEVKTPWALIGDFNYVLKTEERSSNSGASSSFIDWVDGNGLVDLGFIGSKFTWSYGTSVETRRTARLDRALCCNEWRRLFPEAIVRHLNHAYFDHCPVLLDLNGQDGGRMGESRSDF